MMRVVRHLFLLGALALLAAPASAQASPVTDCARDGRPGPAATRTPSSARRSDNIPTDLDEYGDLPRDHQPAPSRAAPTRAAGARAPPARTAGRVGPDEQSARTKDSQELAALAGDGSSDPHAPSVDVGGETVKPGNERPVRPGQRQQRPAGAPAPRADRARRCSRSPACSGGAARPHPGPRRASHSCPRSRPRVSRPHAPRAAEVVLGGALAGVAFGAAGGSELTRTTIVEVLMVLLGGVVVAAAILLGRPRPGLRRDEPAPCSPRSPHSRRCR